MKPRYDRILGSQPVPLHQISGRSAVASIQFFHAPTSISSCRGMRRTVQWRQKDTRVRCPKTRARSALGDLDSPRCAFEMTAPLQAGKFRHGFTEQGQACQGVSVRWWHNAESLTSTARQTWPGERIRAAHTGHLHANLSADV